MKVLIACERSGVVRRAFRAKGHDAWSCDMVKADDDSPHHIMGDAIAAAYGDSWDLMIGHPPCTFLCNSSVHLLTCGRPQEANRWQEMRDGAAFFLKLWNAPINRVCLENPVMHGHAQKLIGVDWTQRIQPFEFGDPESKQTCLWLRNLPPLRKTYSQESDLFLPVMALPARGKWNNQTDSGNNRLAPSPERATLRSKTYQGIADAMADQWNFV